MKLFGKMAFVLLFVVGIVNSGCDSQELFNDPTLPRCTVSYTIVFNNTSGTDMHMGIDSQPSISDLVQASGSRNLPGETVTLLTTDAHEEEHQVEMYVRSPDGQINKFPSYSIQPKQWAPAADPADVNHTSMSLQITCVYNGIDAVVSAIQL